MKRIGIALGVAAVVAIPWIWSEAYSLKLLTLLGIYVLLATGMNIVWGLAGQISLGQNGLYAIGAYASGVLTAKLSVPVLLAVPAAMLLGGLAACVIAMPALRVKGFYLAMISLGFGLLVQTLAKEWAGVTGGVQGLENIPSPTLHTLQVGGWHVSLMAYYYATFLLAGLGMLVASNLIRSYWGRSMAAVRESEIAAAAQGIFVGKVKVAAFVIGGMYTALAGALYAHQIAYVSPEAFDVDMAVLILIMPLVGGLGTLWGPAVGAVVFLALPELLRGLWQYNLLIYGIILTASFTLFPQGVIGRLRRRGQTRSAQAITSPRAEVVAQPPVHSGQPSLIASGIGVRFGGLAALDEVNLELHPGRIHALIGPNGSGKSTLVNVLSRIYIGYQGTIRINGVSVDGFRPDQAARAGLARTFQNLRLFTDLSAFDNVLIGAHPKFHASILGCMAGTRRARQEEVRERETLVALLDTFHLSERAAMSAGALSYGDQKMLELARAMAKRPRLLLLDEPAAGLSAVEIDMLRRAICAAAADGVAVLVIEHNMDFVMGIADEITVLDAGRKISQGLPSAVRADERVIEAYLGSAV
jgi:branched-chain amino acid transport system permease protein